MVDASHIEVYPVLSESGNVPPRSVANSEKLKEMFLQQQMVGQYVAEGHTVTISFQGKNIKYIVLRVSTAGPAPTPTSDNTATISADRNYMARVSLNTVIAIIAKPEDIKKKEAQREANGVDFSIIGGLKPQIEVLKELVELPLKRPEVFDKYGIAPPRGVLLYGPPGTGKTLLAKVLANVTGASCFALSAPEIMSKYYGESEAKLRDIFENAQAKAPAIIFIDEIDAIAPKRDSSDSEVSKRIVATLLTLMDGMDSTAVSAAPSSSKSSASYDRDSREPSSNSSTTSAKNSSIGNRKRVVVLAATNRPNALDAALRRPGRFDREIEVPIPNEAGRLDILNVYFSRMQHSLAPQDIATVASITHGYVGADLSNLCKEAAMCAFKRYLADTQSSVGSLSLESLSITLPESEVKEATQSTSNESAAFVSLIDVQHAMAEIRPSAMREIMVDIPKVAWEDIGGYEEVKEKLKQAVEWPLRHPEAFRRLRIQPTRGILLYGPPGCSKTLMAKAVATQAGLNFIPIKGPELFSKYVGESERAVREVFRKARAAAPAIVFFDEIDAIGGERGQGNDSNAVHDRVLAQMLNELDGIEPLKSVLFLAATNRPDIIDKALMRPGRIDQAIYISPPDNAARRKILEICLKKIPHSDDLNLDQLVSLTNGYSGAEITSACREAGLAALQEDINATIVQYRHFVTAIASIVPTITESMIRFYTNFASQRHS